VTRGCGRNSKDFELLPGNVRDFYTPPTLLDGLFPGVRSGFFVSEPTIPQMIIILVHRVMLPKLRFLRGSSTTEKENTQAKHRHQLFHSFLPPFFSQSRLQPLNAVS
jgi:hypothetical protein